jgi:hypothetical protein
MVKRVSESPAGGVWNSTPDGFFQHSFRPFFSLSRGLRESRQRHAQIVNDLVTGPLGKNFRPQDLSQLSSLAKEPGEEMFAEALVNFGQQQESLRRYDVAAACYTAVATSTSLEAPRQRARARLEVLGGGGRFGDKVEFFGRELSSDQFLDPALFLGIGFARVTGEAFRLAAFSRLAFSPAARWVGSRAGAQVLAWGIGSAAELPALTLGMRGIREALGQKQDWGAPALGRDLLVNGLALFSLNATGLASRSTLDFVARRANPGLVLRFSQAFVPQAAMFAGLSATQAVTDPDASLVQSLAFLFQYNVVGQLAGIGGSTYRSLAQTRAQVEKVAPPRSWAWAVQGSPSGRLTGSGRAEVPNSSTLQMSKWSELGQLASAEPSPVPAEPRVRSGTYLNRERIREGVDSLTGELLRIRMSGDPANTWGMVSERNIRQIIPFIRTVRDNPEMALADTDTSYLDDLILELSTMGDLFLPYSPEEPGALRFPPSKQMEVERFLDHYYRFVNQFINYLLEPSSGLPLSLSDLRHAHSWLRVALKAVDDPYRAEMHRFPYQRKEDGRFHLLQPGLNIGVLGDDYGVRASELAEQGHQVISFTPQSTPLEESPEAHVFEAYFPEHFNQVSPRSASSRRHQLTGFLHGNMVRQLAPRGSGLILTDRHDVIEDLSDIIQEDPKLRLLEVVRRSTNPPLVAGKLAMAEPGENLVSWLVFQRKGPASVMPPPLPPT